MPKDNYNGYLDCDQTFTDFYCRELGGSIAQLQDADPARCLREWWKKRKAAQNTSIGTSILGLASLVGGVIVGAPLLTGAGVLVGLVSGLSAWQHGKGAIAHEAERETLDDCPMLLPFLAQLEASGIGRSELVSVYNSLMRAVMATEINSKDPAQLKQFFQAKLESRSAFAQTVAGFDAPVPTSTQLDRLSAEAEREMQQGFDARLAQTPTETLSPPAGDLPALQPPPATTPTPESTHIPTQPTLYGGEWGVSSSAIAPIDLALQMAQRLTSRIVCAAPRTGKGLLIFNALEHIRRLRPDIELWALDIKADPGENGYYQHFAIDKLLRINLMGFDKPPSADERIGNFFRAFSQSTAVTKLLWLNEGVSLSAKLDKALWKNIQDFAVGLCSAGSTGNDGQTGRFLWIDTQSPNVSDLGLRTNAARNVFRRVFLLNSDRSLLPSAISSGFAMAISEESIAELQATGSKVLAYDSLSNDWLALPIAQPPSAYATPEQRSLRAQLEGLPETPSDSPSSFPEPPETFPKTLEAGGKFPDTSEPPEAQREVGFPASDDWRKYFPEASETVEKTIFFAYCAVLEAGDGKGKQRFIAEVLEAGTSGRKYQAANKYLDYLSDRYGKGGAS